MCFRTVESVCGVFVGGCSGKWVWCICGWLPWKVGGVYLCVVTIENGWGEFVGGYSGKWVGCVSGWLQCGTFVGGYSGN